MISLRRFLKVTLLADKGYDSDAIVEHVAILGAVAVIPPKRNRKQQREYDKIIYKQRNRIERCFSRLKHFTASPPAMKAQKQLQRTRRPRLLLAAPSAICRYCLKNK
jgi:transposase